MSNEPQPWRYSMFQTSVVRSVAVLCAVTAASVLPVRVARAQCNVSVNCIPPVSCAYTSSSVVNYPGGAQISSIRLHDPTDCVSPPGPGETLTVPILFMVDLSYQSIDPAVPGDVHSISGHDGLIIIRYLNSDPLGDHYELELSGLAFTGSPLPAGVMFRESHALPSLGLTTIRTAGAGLQIDSFFDIFTELSLDGGATWLPGSIPSRNVATSEVTPVRPSTWGALKILYR